MEPADQARLAKLARVVRYYSLASTTAAGSGHPSSSLSAADLMVGLMFGGLFRYEIRNPKNPNNDRLIFSKGHASPLFYSLWLAAGGITADEMMTYRKFGSRLEGHPAVELPYVEAPTGSLGQGLAIGAGVALNARHIDRLPYRTYVLLGDSEMAEGSQYESLQLAAHYKLGNLIGILDVNRLGQRGETMCGRDTGAYQRRVAAFGWRTYVIDGHSFPEIVEAYQQATAESDQPAMIIARTVKGKGVSFIEDKNGWHGRALTGEEFQKALQELGDVDVSVRGQIQAPEELNAPALESRPSGRIEYDIDRSVATREAYGNALKRIYPQFPNMVALDGEVSNSTKAETFAEAYPQRFFEMYIAEQNMAGMALGLSSRGKIPFASTFSAFWTRAYDQIRMSQYAQANIKFVGSHAGVSVGEDGPSQMGLEDIAMFRTIQGSVVFHPCDAVSTEKLVEVAAGHEGIVYLRTLRGKTPVIYDSEEEFRVGGCKVLRHSEQDVATLVAAGVTVHEALKAHASLLADGVSVRVIDLYSIKPLDAETLLEAVGVTEFIITIEDHYPEGGLGEAVRSALGTPVHSLAVSHKPRSGTAEELRDYEEISSKTIVQRVKDLQMAMT